MQRLRQHEPAFIRYIESIKGFRVRIKDFLGDKFPGGEVLDLEACTCHRDNIAGLRVAFLHFQPCRSGTVIQDIAVSLSIGRNKDRKIGNKCFSFFAGDLVNRITAIRQHFGSRKTIIIRCQQVTLTFLCRVIAACRLQVNLKNRAGLRAFNDTLIGFVCFFISGHIRVQVIRMLHKLDISVNDRFCNLVLGGIQFHFIQGRGSTHLIDRIV